MFIGKTDMDRMKVLVQQEGKYFLLDKDEADPALDEFQHAKVAETIVRVIAENPPPFVIGIFGSWGSGKSTIANFLRRRIQELDPSAKWVQVSVWHHSPETLPQASYKELMKSLGHSSSDITLELTSKVTLQDLELDKAWEKLTKEFWFLLLTVLPVAVLYTLICVAAHILYMFSTGDNPTVASTFQALSSFAWIPFVGALAKYLLDRMKTFEIKREVSPPNSLDQYAEKFSDAVKNKRVFVLIDDLDRLSPKKIVRALEIMKSYMNAGAGSCVFIVPCDDHVLRDAVEEVKSLDEPDGDKYLEKFFQFTFRVPRQLFPDLREYARRLLLRINSPLLQHPGFDESLELLIYPDVKTPRHVKKLLNEFSALYMLLQAREQGEDPLIPPGEATARLDFIATLSVLRSDFPEYYAAMERNPGVLDYTLQVLSNGVIDSHQRKMLDPYLQGTAYESSNGPGRSNAVNESLVRFLLRSSHTIVSDTRPFLYFRADRTRFVIKDEASRSLRADIISGNVRAVQNAFALAVDKSVVFDFSLQILEPLSSLDLRKGLIVLYELSDELANQPGPLRERVANFWIKFGTDIRKELYDPERLLNLLDFVTDTDRRDRLIVDRINDLGVKAELDAVLLGWLRALLRRPKMSFASSRLTKLCRQLSVSVPVTSLTSLFDGFDIVDETVGLLGDEALYKLGMAALDVEESQEDDEQLQVLRERLLPVAIGVYPETLFRLLEQYVRAGDSLGDYAVDTLTELPSWITPQNWYDLLAALTLRFSSLTDHEDLDHVVDLLSQILNLVPKENRSSAELVIIQFMQDFLVSGSEPLLSTLARRARLIRNSTDQAHWGEFDAQLVAVFTTEIGTPKGDVLQAWVIDWFKLIGDDARNAVATTLNGLLHQPKNVAVTRSARMMVVSLWGKGLSVYPQNLASALVNLGYPLDARRELSTAVATIMQGFKEANQEIVWNSVANGLLNNSALDELRFGLEIAEQFPWPPPNSVTRNLLTQLWTRLPAASDALTWNRALPVLQRLRTYMDEDQQVQHLDWIATHISRDAASASRHAFHQWRVLGAERRARISIALTEHQQHPELYQSALTAWESIARDSSATEVLEQIQAFIGLNVSLELLEQVMDRFIGNMSSKIAADIAKRGMETVLSASGTVQESWLLVTALAIKRSGREIPDCSQVFIHLLSGNGRNSRKGFLYLSKARRELTEAEETSLATELERYLLHVPIAEFPGVVAGIRKLSRNRRLLDAAVERWEKERVQATAETVEAMNVSLGDYKKKRRWLELR